MTGVSAGKNENFESLLKRFNRTVQQSGILAEVRHRAYFEAPGVKRKRKEAAKRRSTARTSER
ncbi:MAG: 30S ribosomal protein S21 [Dehalococcoidales bacterium]|nr:30S ribosomal protein S21 [Dehalococcoidales bacterium]